MSRRERLAQRIDRGIEWVADHKRTALFVAGPMMLWVIGAAFTLFGYRTIGYIFFGFVVGFTLIHLALTLLDGRLPWRKKKDPPSIFGPSVGGDMLASLDPIHGHVSTTFVSTVCERCGREHRNVREAYQFHTRRRLWLHRQPYDEILMGRPVRVHMRRENQFLADLGLLLNENDRMMIEHSARMDDIMGRLGS